jgi:peptidyl-tRNA hydrolase ICT1
LDKVEFQFARSSGPGGQNVNKLNTKAEIRFNLTTADWIPEEVKQRLREAQGNKISKNGEIIISSQEHRTQAKNKEDCITKLQEMLAEAYVEPKERAIWEGLGEKGKEMRVQERKKRSAVKDFRRKKNFDFDD